VLGRKAPCAGRDSSVRGGEGGKRGGKVFNKEKKKNVTPSFWGKGGKATNSGEGGAAVQNTYYCSPGEKKVDYVAGNLGFY